MLPGFEQAVSLPRSSKEISRAAERYKQLQKELKKNLDRMAAKATEAGRWAPLCCVALALWSF